MNKIQKKYLIYDYIYKDLVKNKYNNSEAVNRLLFLGMQRENIQKRYAELEVWLTKVHHRLDTLETASINLTDTLNFLFDDDEFLNEDEKVIMIDEQHNYKLEHIDKFIEEQEMNVQVELEKLEDLKKLKIME